MTETIRPIKPKIFTIWPFSGKACPPLFSTICSLYPKKEKEKEKNNKEALHALIWNDLPYMLLSGKGNMPNSPSALLVRGEKKFCCSLNTHLGLVPFLPHKNGAGLGSSLVVQRLELCASSTRGPGVLFQLGELRSYKPRGTESVLKKIGPLQTAYHFLPDFKTC